MKIRARAVSSDNTKPTIVLNLPGVFFAVLMSAYDSFVHLGVTLSSAATLLLATYVACVLAWNVLASVLALLVQGAAYYIAKPVAVTASTPPLLRVGGRIIASKSTHVDKTNDAAASKRKERQAPAVRRRVLAQLNRNRLLVNVVPGTCRVDMNLGEANFVRRKPCDVYVMRVDCGAQSADQEKHMNPVIMWDVTATFDKFKQLERELEKEVKAKKASRGVQVPHVSSGAVLFVQPELTDHVLNARLQTFIDTLRSDPVLSTMGCLRKFCQTY
uniref:PX domain-containing protein n=1 Tax=Phytophthora ramorum TaxID=164328 RepID=H3H999_PHYRM